nr:MFS transporter permease [Actinoplanes sp. N902-109]
MAAWLTEAVPRGRIAAFRTLVYLFVAADLVVFTPWVRNHASTPGELYQPLLVARLLHLPTPTALLVHSIFWLLLVLALAAATGRAPRLLGWAVFALYFEWMIIAMSYGKVDHDRFGLLVALAALPTAGRARHGDPARTEAGGWAVRVTQIAVVCTYFLAAWAKLRFGGIDWVTSSVLARAIVRRGTELADLIAGVPYLLILAQFGIIVFELASPVIFFVKPRWRSWTVAFFYSFHLVTFATITISFAPHLAALTSFLALEKVRPVAWTRGFLAKRRGHVEGHDRLHRATPPGGGGRP